MNRRQAIKTTFKAAALASVLRPGIVQCQEAAPKPGTVDGNTIYLNPATGVDTNPGAKGSPLRTLSEAARRVSQLEGSGSVTVILSEGVYAVGETATFKPAQRKFTRTDRLTIRAEVLPDDPEWHPGRMPTLIHTLPLTGRGLTFGMLTEANHVTVRGLKLLGAPVVETPKPGMLIRVYPIGRMGRDLDDLEISQCLFAGDKLTSPNHLGILAHGSGIQVHHCIFFNAKLTVVFWTRGSGGHSMRNCFVHGAYGSGVWTTEIAEDFDFRENVIANGNYVWTYQSGASAGRDPDAAGRRSNAPAATANRQPHYKVVNSLLAANKKMACSGTGANLGFKDIDSSFLELINTKVTDEPVPVEFDETKRNYLHPVEGSEAAKIRVGLFMKSS